MQKGWGAADQRGVSNRKAIFISITSTFTVPFWPLLEGSWPRVPRFQERILMKTVAWLPERAILIPDKVLVNENGRHGNVRKLTYLVEIEVADSDSYVSNPNLLRELGEIDRELELGNITEEEALERLAMVALERFTYSFSINELDYREHLSPLVRKDQLSQFTYLRRHFPDEVAAVARQLLFREWFLESMYRLGTDAGQRQRMSASG